MSTYIGIPSANRPKAISQLLESLKKQDNFENFEVIVVNGTERSENSTNNEYKTICDKYPNVLYHSDEGGPANGRKIVTSYLKDEDIVVFLDDDTFPKTKSTIKNLVDFLISNKHLDIVSGVWDCQKVPDRAYGEVLILDDNYLYRQEKRDQGLIKVDIPLATFCCSGKIAKCLSFDSNIPFYGDMFDMGISIMQNNIRCAYNTSFVFDHIPIENVTPSTKYREINKWQYIADKWSVSFIRNSFLYTPQNIVGTNTTKQLKQSDDRKAFIVELNSYHFETLPIWANLLDSLEFNVDILTLQNNIGISEVIRQSAPLANHYTFQNKSEILQYLEKNLMEDDFLILNSAGTVLKQKYLASEIYNYTIDHLKSIYPLVAKPKKYLLSVHHGASTKSIRDIYAHKAICLQPTMAKLHDYHFLPVISNHATSSSTNKKVKYSQKRIVIAGLLEKKRRDYHTIVRYLIQYFENNPESTIKVNILGSLPNGDKNSFIELFEQINNKGLNKFFELPDINQNGKISSEIFNSIIDKSQFLLYGINPLVRKQFPYVYSKATGSYSLSLMNALVPLVHKNVATAYEIQNISLTYTDYDSFAAMIFSIDNASEEEIEMMRNKVSRAKELLATYSKSKMKALLQ